MVWIGGHPHSWPQARDFNLKQDIAAAQVLFDSGVPLVHVPAGDVAAALTITLPELEAGLKGKSPIADALYQNVDGYYRKRVRAKSNREAARTLGRKSSGISPPSPGCWSRRRWSPPKWFPVPC